MVLADAYFRHAFMRARCFPELVSLEARNGCFSFLPHRQREAVIELAYTLLNSYEGMFQMRCACGTRNFRDVMENHNFSISSLCQNVFRRLNNCPKLFSQSKLL